MNASATYTYHPHREWLASHDLGANLGAAAKYFRFDEVGNLIGRDLASPTAPANQVRDPARPNRLLSYTRGSTTTTLAYDDDGNVVRRGGQHFGFDSASRLTCVGTGSTEAAGLCATARYRYDPTGDERSYEWSAAGERLHLGQFFEWHKGTSASTLHVLVGGRRVASVERASDTLAHPWLPPFWEPPVPWRVLGLGAAAVVLLVLLVLAWRLGVPQEALRRPVPAALSLGLSLLLVPGQYALAAPPPPSGVVKRWFVEDHLGSATLALDELGNVVERRVFEPFGKVFQNSSPPVTSPRFTGKRYSAAAALYDFGARWYDPELGRFAQIDPIVQSPLRPIMLNAYAYAGNDPVNKVDRDGRGFWDRLLGVVQGFTPIIMTVGAVFLVAAATGTLQAAGSAASASGAQATSHTIGHGLVSTVVSGPGWIDAAVVKVPILAATASAAEAAPAMSATGVIGAAGIASSATAYSLALDAVLRNQPIPNSTLEQLKLAELNHVAQRRVEIALDHAKPGSIEYGMAELLERDLNLARYQIKLGFGVTSFENVLLAANVLFPGKSVGEIVATAGDVAASASGRASNPAPEIVRQGFMKLNRIAGTRIPW